MSTYCIMRKHLVRVPCVIDGKHGLFKFTFRSELFTAIRHQHRTIQQHLTMRHRVSRIHFNNVCT